MARVFEALCGHERERARPDAPKRAPSTEEEEEGEREREEEAGPWAWQK